MAKDSYRIGEYQDGTYFLTFVDFDASAAVNEAFEEAGYESGGYAWHGLVDALVRTQAPHLAPQVSYDPESGMFVARSANREALVQVAALMRDVTTDAEMLQEALSNVDPELMD